MTIDDLRSRILQIWIAGIVLSYVMLTGAAIMRLYRLSFDDIAASSRDLSTIVAPTVLMIVGHYFVDRQTNVTPTPGQVRIVLLLSALYVIGFVAITAVMLFVEGSKINQPGINNYSWLAPWQPVVVGPTFYIFGVSKRSQESAQPPL